MCLNWCRIQAAGNLSGATVLLETGSVWVDEALVLDGLVNGRLGAFGDATRPRPAILTSRSAAIDPVRLGNPNTVTPYMPWVTT